MTVQEIAEINPEDASFPQDMLLFLAENVPYDFHLQKAAEECFELGEVIMKTLNKSVAKRPPKEELCKEFGDLFLRMQMVYYTVFKDECFGPPGTATIAYALDKVNEQIYSKLKQLHASIKAGRLYNLKM